MDRLSEAMRLQAACISWAAGIELLRQDMAAGALPSPDRVRQLLLSAAATGAALGHMDDLQARAHLEAAGQLRVDISSEAEQLSEAAKAYCVCQSLYDEGRPMLGCDHCSDWFHWECVGLEAPRDDQDDAELVPQDYR
eukprot:gene9819-9977_t